MSLSVFSAKQYKTKLKVTVQATGKLGFTSETANVLGLTKDTYIKIASDDKTKELYMIVCEGIDEDGFKVQKVGDYFSLPTTLLFNELDEDFKNYTIIYDLKREPELDNEARGKVYKMTKRINIKKKKEA